MELNDDDDDADPSPRHVVSYRQFAAFHLHQRLPDVVTLFRMGRLFQEYVCDLYATHLRQRLEFIENHQREMSVASYAGIQVSNLGIHVMDSAV